MNEWEPVYAKVCPNCGHPIIGELHFTNPKNCQFRPLINHWKLTWDDPDSNPLQDIKDQLAKDRDNYGRI